MPKAKNIRDDRSMILAPDRWPMWPLLPLKRPIKGDAPNCGFMHAPWGDETQSLRVWLGYIWGLKPEWDKTMPFKDYPSVDAILADGWKVD